MYGVPCIMGVLDTGQTNELKFGIKLATCAIVEQLKGLELQNFIGFVTYVHV